MQDKRRSSQSGSGELAGAGQSSSFPGWDTPAVRELASGHLASWGDEARLALSQGRRRSRHGEEGPAAARAGPVKRASAEGIRLVQAQSAAPEKAQATPPGPGRANLEDGAALLLQTARPLPGASGLQSGQQLHGTHAGALSDDSLQTAAGPLPGAGRSQSGLQAGLQPHGSHASGQLPSWLGPEVVDDMAATSGAERAAAADRVATHLGHFTGHRPLARSQTFSSGSPLPPLHVRTGFGSPSVGPRVSGDAWSPFSPARSSPKVTVVCRICEEKVGPVSVVHPAVEEHSAARCLLCCPVSDGMGDACCSLLTAVRKRPQLLAACCEAVCKTF